MAGAMRPYTLADILGAISGSNSSAGGETTISGLGYIAEADETSTSLDAVTTLLLTAAPAWEQNSWGTMSWS